MRYVVDIELKSDVGNWINHETVVIFADSEEKLDEILDKEYGDSLIFYSINYPGF